MPIICRPRRRLPFDGLLRRTLDVLGATFGLLLLAPLLLVIAVAVRADSRGPVLFGQPRIGRGGKAFVCLKFRSMRPDAEAQLARLLALSATARREWELTQKLEDDPRITRLGRFLRQSSLDELPQLFNVLKGDMSLVGPRPITASEAYRYGRALRHYTALRPGITGLWQVSGRSRLSYGRRVAMDVLYARRHCALWYVALLLKTIPAVLSRDGSY